MPIDGSPLSRRTFVRGVGAVLAAGAAAPALAACGSGSTTATSGGKTSITFASAKFFAQESIGQIVDEYNQSQNLVNVQFQQLPTPSQSTEVHQQLVQALSQRDGSIDVYTGDIIWISEFAGAGWSAPLDDYFGPSVQAQYFPGVINACTYSGQMHALPWYLDAGMLYYRKDLLDAANIPVPTQWSELVSGAQKLIGAGKVTDGFNWQAKRPTRSWCR
jgi:multiple sugar transport system substrate-binding protein